MRWSRFLVLGSIGTAVYLAVPSDRLRGVAYGVIVAASLAAFWWGIRRKASLNAFSWKCVTVGALAWAAGDLVGGVYLTSIPVVPVVSVADAFYLFGHLAFVVGALSLRDDNGRVFRTEDLLEGLIVGTGLALMAWIFVVGTRIDTDMSVRSLVEYWPAVVYTFANGVLMALMVLLLLSKRARSASFVLLTLAFLSFTTARWTSYVEIDGWELRESGLVGAGWLAGYVLLAAAALVPSVASWSAQQGSDRLRVDGTRLVGLSAAILMPPVVMGVQLARGVPVGEWGWVVLGSSVAAVGLLAARMGCFLSALRHQADELTEAAMSDSVTGLASRRHVRQLLDRSVAQEGADGVVVFIVDIDRFAQINETFGYPLGDQVLKEIGQRLVCAAVGGSVVGRLGGDQFVVSMASRRMLVSAAECAEHFRSAVSTTMFVRDINVALDATVGVAESANLDDVDADALLQHAHVALTSAKHGHTRYSVYMPSMDCDRHEQMRLLGELETALRERQLRVFFQPCLNLRTGRVSGAEALLRWQHPREGLIAPWSFLPDAERTGLLPAITAYVLEDALECCSVMRRKHPDFGVSVNLSVRNLLDPSLVEQVASALQRHDVPAKALEFEVTETTAMTDPRRSVDSLVALRDLGVTVAIDDYGTGYSSLAYLRSLPVQTLKIDKSFVTAMNSQPTNASIVRSTIDLARSLGMTVVAEGVEDSATLESLRELECDAAQGFQIGRPVSGEELEALVQRIESEPSLLVQRRRPRASAAEVVGSAAQRI